MSVRVYRESPRGDWVFSCDLHDKGLWCGTWVDAMEAAYGHLFMHHKARPRPLWEVTISDGTHSASALVLGNHLTMTGVDR